MTASILDHLDRLADEHPDKLLYSYLDVNGDPIESYTYASFIHRTEAIAGHLLKEGRFAPGDRLLLAYPPGLEMICAFFGCVRAGLIPVPVYPPSSRGFQSALYKMVHIAKDCQAAGDLNEQDYQASLKTNLARSGVSACGIDVDYISGLPWIATEDFVDVISDRPAAEHSKILFLQYTSGSTMEPKGVIVTHENILDTCALVIDHPVAGRRFLASAVSRYGTDRVLPISGTEGWHNVRVLSHGLHSAADPVVRCHDGLPCHSDRCSQLRLRLLPARREAFQGEPGGLVISARFAF